MLGILRGSLVTVVASICGDFSPDAKTKLRRTINRAGRSFSQLSDWAFLHTTVTFSITDGITEYGGSGYLPLGFQRFLATKLKDSNGDYVPIEEKSLSWYESIQDPTFEGQPFAVVLRGIDSSGYQKAVFYYTPDQTYTFECDCSIVFTDVDETSTGDATRVIITQDCYDAFSYWIAKAYAVEQGDDEVIARCNIELWGNPAARIPGVLQMLLSKQRGAGKWRKIQPDSSYKSSNILGTSDYGRKIT